MGRGGRAARRLLTTLAAAAAAVLLLAAPASAEPLGSAADAFRAGERLYVDPAAATVLSPADQARVRDAARGASTPVYVAVLPTTAQRGYGNSGALLDALYRATGRTPGTYIVLFPSGVYVGSSVVPDRAAAIGQAARSASSPAASVLQAIADTEQAARQEGRAAAGTPGGGGSGLATLVVMVALVGGGLFALLLWRRSRRRHAAEQAAAEFAPVRAAAEEDVTRLGEDIAALDLDLTAPSLPDEARADYQRALDCYDRAKQALAVARGPADLAAVSEQLAEGRFAMAATRARLSGAPVPERRAPCFFNPQHGPSVEDVTWAPPGGAARAVPACAADAERVRAGADPDSRLVTVGGARRPYWEGGPAYAPWAGGYFGGYGFGGNLLGGLLVGTLLGNALGGFGTGWAGAPGGYGDGAGGDTAGDFAGGGGGWDSGGSGGDSGGWDSGSWDSGGDFGGGDW